MTADLDRLELELRSVPGVVCVGLEAGKGQSVVVQVCALTGPAAGDLRERVRRIIDSSAASVSLELMVEAGRT